MKDGNTLLSPAAQEATDRIRTLRTLTQKTGIITRDEQIKILFALGNTDLLAVIGQVGGGFVGAK